MSKEIEQEIAHKKELIAKLIKDLKSKQSFFSLSSSIDTNVIQENLVKHRLELVNLYKTHQQFNDALEQLSFACDYYKNPGAKSLDSQQILDSCINILMLQIECYESIDDKEQHALFLAELIDKLLLTTTSKYKRDIPRYLKKYADLVPEDAISSIPYIISKLNLSLFGDETIYKFVLDLQTKLLCAGNNFKAAYETCTTLIAYYEKTKKSIAYSTNLTTEELTAYLTLCGLSHINDNSIDANVYKIIKDYCQKYRLILADHEIIFEPELERNEQELARVALVFDHLNVPIPSWFPPHHVRRLEIQVRQESTNYSRPISKDTNYKDEIRLKQQIPLIPEYEKLRERITLGWEQHGVGGYKAETRYLVEQLFIPRALPPEVLELMGLKLPSGGILYGPPGTGKTLMARTIANYFFDEENVTVINGAELISKYVGQSAENLRKILELARLKPNVTHVVIIDEIDALVCSRGGNADDNVSKQIKADLTTTLLTYLDGVHVIENLMIIGLTNYFGSLDNALTRAGRLEAHVEINLPNYDDRLAILKLYLADLQQKNMVCDALNIPLLAEKSEGLCGASIKAFIDLTVKKFALSQIVSFEQGTLKIGDAKKIEPLNDVHFLTCLNEIVAKNGQKKSDQEILFQRPFYPFNEEMEQNLSDIREEAQSFSYMSPMIINACGPLGAGTTSVALHLFSEMPENAVYMKAGELVNLSPKEQQKYIDECFTKALKSEQGVLIIDDLEDINACMCNPIIYLKNKLKMPLDLNEQLKVILVSKKENTVESLFGQQILCDATAKVPLITKKEEILVLIDALGLDFTAHSAEVALKCKLTVSVLKSQLLSYCKTTEAADRSINDFINNLNSLYAGRKNAANEHRIFSEGAKNGASSSNQVPVFQLPT